VLPAGRHRVFSIQPLGLPAVTTSKPVWFRTPLAWGGKDFAKFSSVLMHPGVLASGARHFAYPRVSAHLRDERPQASLELLWNARQPQKAALRATRKSKGDHGGGQHENLVSRPGNDAWRRVLPATPCETVPTRLRVRTPAIRFRPPTPGPRQEEPVAAVRRLTIASAASLSCRAPCRAPGSEALRRADRKHPPSSPGGRVLFGRSSSPG
jgi:hypothetical protein